MLQGIFQSTKQVGDVLPKEALNILEQHNNRLNRVEEIEEIEYSLQIDYNRSLTDSVGARLSNLVRNTRVAMLGN